MNDKKQLRIGRRGLLGAAASVSVGLLMRSLATGLPVSILTRPLEARGDELPSGRMLILSSSSQGDPINANVPGTYDLPDTEAYHALDPSMAKTAMTLGSNQVFGAKVWADLPANILQRTSFFHHATYTPVHGEMPRVQKLLEATEKDDMLISLLARELAPGLGTVQSDPVSLGASGGELLSSSGRLLGNVAPLSVRQALGDPSGPLGDLRALRDQHMDAMYALYRDHGTPSQRRLLDAWGRSREEARSVSDDLLSLLDSVDGNDEANQVKTAVILAAMNIAPVITIRLDFGGDNHNDTDLANEVEKHQTGVAHLQSLVEQIDQLRQGSSPLLKHDVLVGSLNVFGRTFKKKARGGRDHNSGHHVMVLMGTGVRPGVIGGIMPNNAAAPTEYVASPIASATGLASASGDIPYEQTLGSAGKSLGYALGLSEQRMDELVDTGKVVTSIRA